MSQWKTTKHPGVRYREHPTRKHGVQKDKYFAIRFQRDGKRAEEGLGWASEGWTAEKAAQELAALKKAHTTGEGPSRLSEKRMLEEERRRKEQTEKARQDKENVTFGEYFKKYYFPISKTSRKPESCKKDQEHFKKWIKPILGDKPFKEITPFLIEKLKKKMLDSDLSPRSIQYNFATIRQAWNMARRDGLVREESPTRAVKLPKVDNKRVRFLTVEEAEKLLQDLQTRDETTYRMALLSLRCGLRAGEIFALKWGHVDLEKGMLAIMDAKGNKNRVAFMTEDVKTMFSIIVRRGLDDLVFPDREGGKFEDIPRTFESAVKALGLNDGIEDPRQKVVFHTLRHTYASWLVEAGTDLYTVKTLLGHGTITMTERYSHLGNGTLQNAVRNLEKKLKQPEKGEKVGLNRGS